MQLPTNVLKKQQKVAQEKWAPATHVQDQMEFLIPDLSPAFADIWRANYQTEDLLLSLLLYFWNT